MNQEIKEKWVEALRSGKYKQGRSRLKDNENHYCCLGVLCDIRAKEFNTVFNSDESKDFPGSIVMDWAGLKHKNPNVMFDGSKTDIATLNDDKHLSFKEIANIIEAQL